MHSKVFFTPRTAFVASIFIATVPAQATDYVFDAGGGTCDWHTPANWDPTGVPSSFLDSATLPNGSWVCLNANATVGALELHETATLQIAPSSSATLTIDKATGAHSGLIVVRATSSGYGVIELGTAGGSTTAVLELKNNNGSAHQIGGDIILRDDASRLDVETDSATFGPYSTRYFGSVVGQHNSAKVEIEHLTSLTSQITFEGMMVIGPEAEDEQPTFVNDRVSTDPGSGLLWANLAGTLKLDDDLVLSDSTYIDTGPNPDVTYRPLWKASVQSTAELEFNRAVTGAGRLVGNFEVNNCATLQFLASVETTGGLTQYGTVNTNGSGAPSFSYNWVNSFCFTQISSDSTVPNPCQ